MTYYTLVRRLGDGRAEKDDATRQGLDRLLPLMGAPEGTPLSHDDRGRPCLPHLPKLFISISHAAPFTAVALSDAPVGVDIEDTRGIRDPKGLAERFFTEAEQRAVLTSDAPLEAALSVWTGKEAVGKYLGSGLAGIRTLSTHDLPDGTALYREVLYECGVRYELCLCAHSVPIPVCEPTA